MYKAGNRHIISRRHFGKLLGAGGAVLATPMLASSANAQAANVIRIGFVAPHTGPLSIFAAGDQFLIDHLNANLSGVIDRGAESYQFEVYRADTQSNETRAAQATAALINEVSPDMIIGCATPQTVNPVATTAEQMGVPCLTTAAPWEAVYFGRGAIPGAPSPFKWSYHFSFGSINFVNGTVDTWNQVPNNGLIGVFLPNDADGDAIRMGALPAMEAAGMQIFDPGAYQVGQTDFRDLIDMMMNVGVGVSFALPIPADYQLYWRQAVEMGFADQVQIAHAGKACLFAEELEMLGNIGHGTMSGAYWHPSFPYASSATGMTNREIAENYMRESGLQWNQQVGATASLLDAAVIALQNAGDPKDKESLVETIATLKCDTAVGPIDFNTGPVPNIATTSLVGTQWIKQDSGPWTYDMEIVSNADNTDVPVTAQAIPYPALR